MDSPILAETSLPPNGIALSGTLQTSKLHIVIIDRGLGFPNGMATSQRIKLLAQSMSEVGAEVTVLILYYSERPPIIKNSIPKSTFKGIYFEYTSGTTTRPENYIKRLWVIIKSIFITISRLIQLKRQKKLDCIYFWVPTHQLTFDGILICLVAKLLKVPVVCEVNERPWSLKENRSFFENSISPLRGINGAITISDYLYDWTVKEAKILKKPFSVIRIPIVADTDEQISLNENLDQVPTVLFAGSPGYEAPIRFILNSMHEVWNHYPDCHLKIIGFSDNEPEAAWIKNEIATQKLKNIEFTGYLDRETLLKCYMSAWALLIPLFNDVRSTARFPTKIGEYLLSGRPVITNAVGDISKYLVDDVSALICKPDDAKAYAGKIIEVIENPSRAALIGSNGRQVAIEYFHYAKYGEKLVSFFASMNQGKKV